MSPWLRAGAAVAVIGWGANQFSPLLVVYSGQEHLSSSVVTAIFGTYVVGLIPALLVGAAISDRLGRRRVLRPVLVLSAIASVILAFGAGSTWLLLTGRLVAGIASGAAFGPGTAWIKELSSDAGAGARRAAIALSAGFGGGPLVAGVVAQWLPAPAVTPYIVHVIATVAVAAVVWRTPETVTAAPVPAVRRRDLGRALRSREFRLLVAPGAPLVFGAATTSFATMPALLPFTAAPVAGSGVLAGVTLGSGLLVQPLARVVEQRRAGAVLISGLGVVSGGFLLAATAAGAHLVLLTLPTAVLLGSGYGMLLVAGLTRVEKLAEPDDLASLTAVFYCLAYAGFAVPYVVAAVSHFVPAWGVLMTAAAAVAVLAAVTLGYARKLQADPVS